MKEEIEKKRWTVTLPIAGYALVEVEADNEKEAIDTALEIGCELRDIEEWDAYRKIVSGNVLHASVNEASAEEI